jgi:predicted ATPase/DNA-binding CsgD family transcriptional regulator/Tfp pilus assembly protein PilF
MTSRVENVPQPLTSFIGREQEVAEISRRLETARLVTLTGMGGSGKTRLAIQVARVIVDTRADEVCWIDLAALAAPGLVPQAIASALGVHEQAGRSLGYTVIEQLRPRKLVLVLDNCEHLIEACATLTLSLLTACPGLRILATSREALGVPGETLWPVPPLALPAGKTHLCEGDAVMRIEANESVRLFTERAQAVRRSFALTPDNVQTVASICRRLDGLPLAIELAAARVRILSVEQIEAHLGDLFRLLTSQSRGVSARHQTLHAAMDWSYRLLAADERAVFRWLAVFAGGFSLDAAQGVVGGTQEAQMRGDDEGTAYQTDALPVSGEAVLDVLTRLGDKSLILVGERGGQARYRVLEPVRQFGLQALHSAGEWETVRQRHAAYYLALAETAEPMLRGKEQRAWLERLTGEDDNLRAALEWATDKAPEVALKLAGALWYYWYVRGQMSEGRQWLGGALARGTDEAPAMRAKALHGAATLALRQGDHEYAAAGLQESLAIRLAMGDRRGVATSLNNLGTVADTQGDAVGAESLFGQGLAVFREIGDRWGTALTLNNLGGLAYQRGDYRTARERCEESLAISRSLGDSVRIALALNNLGMIAYLRGDSGVARGYYEESLALVQALGEKRTLADTLGYLGDVTLQEGDTQRARQYYADSMELYRSIGERSSIAASLERMGRLAHAEGAVESAARLFGAAEGLREAIHAPLKPAQRRLYEEGLAQVRGALKPVALARLMAEGRALPVDQAIAVALAPAGQVASGGRGGLGRQPVAPATGPAAGLTGREKEVAILVGRGLTNRSIADALVVGERTVETHVGNILGKLGFTSRAQIASWVAERGWLRREG